MNQSLRASATSFINRNALTIIAFCLLLVAVAGGWVIYKAFRVKDVVEQAPILTKKEAKVLEKQLVDEKELRQEAEKQALTAEKKAVTYEKQAIIHEQQADSLRRAPAYENATTYRTASVERVERFLTNYTAKNWIISVTDTLR